MAADDPLFGIHADALTFQRRRMELLSANIANADTPGYQAKDLDFSKVLALAEQQTGLGTRDSGLAKANYIPLDAQMLDAATVYRVPLQPAADGNTVDLQVEQAQFTDAALHYQASLNFIDSRLRALIAAIGGS
jgi:flagellar basal-body rod protein FlgB